MNFANMGLPSYPLLTVGAPEEAAKGEDNRKAKCKTALLSLLGRNSRLCR